jgi:hypothetical protein
MDQQHNALDKSRELWDEVMKIPQSEMHPDDIHDIRQHLHAIQNILYAQLYLKQKSVTFEIKGENIASVQTARNSNRDLY